MQKTQSLNLTFTNQFKMKKDKKTVSQPKDLEMVHHVHEMPASLEEKNKCESITLHLNQYYEKLRKQKVNTLKACNPCEIESGNLIQIDSIFDAHKLNTAFDGKGGALASGSGNDLNWEVGIGDESGPQSVTQWEPAFVHHHASWVASPFSNANWISYTKDGRHKSGDDKLILYFRIKFLLNVSINLSDFRLDMSFYADNSVNDIYVNGVSQTTNYPNVLPQHQNSSTGSFTFLGFKNGNGADIRLSKDWKTCENELIVCVHSKAEYTGLLVQNSTQCYEAEKPAYRPSLEVKWGDSDCDCIESDDIETMTLTVCNRYSNIDFNNLSIALLQVVHENGKPVATLPNGKPSLEIISMGPYCFGDIPACSCVTRQFALINRGARHGRYKLKMDGICYDVNLHQDHEACFDFDICKD